MTEKEKRDAGLLYDANYDPGVLADLMACKDKCFACNQIPPSHMEERRAAFRTIFKRTGNNFWIQPPITIYLDRKAGQPVRLSLHLVPKLQ